MKWLFLLMGLALSFTGFSQNAIVSDAQKMGAYFVASDWEHYIDYSYPKIVKNLGGREKMKASLQQQMQDLSAKGIQLLSISFGEPSVILKEKRELQATLPQEIIYQTAQGKVQSRTTIIAISTNEGASWYFIDPGGRSLESLRISLPNISKKLTLPPTPPVTKLN